MKKGCIAVFAKTPGLSPLKTRLAKDIGQEKAEEIFISCVNVMEQNLLSFHEQYPEWDIIWTVAEEKGVTHPFWKNRHFPTQWTDDGDFGTCLGNVYNHLKKHYDIVMLIGTDCPQLDKSTLIQTYNFLKTHQNVIGPTPDGGYYLFASHDVIDLEIWQSIPYSSDITRQEFMKRISANIALLPSLTDIDDTACIPDAILEIENMRADHTQELLALLKSI